MRLRIPILALAATSLAGAASAATPDAGTVSASSPSVKWEGTATGYGVFPTNLLLDAAGEGPAPCEAPYCDTFALTVADKADLMLFAAQRGGDNFTELHVIKPDGEMVWAQSGEAEPVRVKVKAAVPGEYTVEVMTNETAAQSGEYDAEATLAVPAQAAPAPAPAPAPGEPAPAPAEPAPADRPAASLGVKTKAVSRRRKAFKLAITSSREVTRVRVALKKGRKVLAQGSLARLDGAGKVRLKARRKLRPGAYQIAMTALDGDRVVGLTTKLKVKK